MSADNTDEKHHGGFEVLIGSPDESRLSEISFPSHVSGLESFMDMDETLEDINMKHTNSQM